MELNDEGKNWLVAMLKSNIVTVTFTKRNGDERIMECTLKPEYFAQDKYQSDSTEDTKLDKTNCTVWDVNAQGWRSFLWTNVKRIEFTHGEAQ